MKIFATKLLKFLDIMQIVVGLFRNIIKFNIKLSRL